MTNLKQLYDHLTLSEQNGTIYMNDERMIVISASAFGTLRKDLITNIGMERMKGFLIRYGWDLGVKDAKKAMEMNLPSVEDVISTGPALHMIKGHTGVRTTFLKVDRAPDQSLKSIHMEGVWVNSYEAEEHIYRFGYSETPVCYTLIGYASGYLSAIFNHTVIVKELACTGTGHTECRWVGKSLELWNGEVDDILQYYEDTPIVKELEVTYEKLLEERNNLSRTSNIHKKLTEEIINGNDLQSIADVVYETTGMPLIIEDAKFRAFAYAGLPPEQFARIDDDFKTYLQKNRKAIHEQKVNHYESFALTSKINALCHSRLITPIVLRKKIIGYCSFVYVANVDNCPEIDLIILERIATVSSLYLLNEKTSFEADERMKGHFLEQLLQGQFASKKEILKRGSYINLDLEQHYYIVVLQSQQKQGQMENELLIHEEVMESTLQYFKDKKWNVLIGQRSGNIVLLVQTESLNKGDISGFSTNFIEYVANLFKKCTFQIGISSKSEHIDRASDSYDEAMISLRMSTPTTRKVVLFESLGVVGLLINSKNESAIKKSAQQLLGTLYDSRYNKNAELIKTLYVFLENGGNLEQTANDLSLSMSGLRYRIQKIENLLGQDLRNPAVHYQLFITLQALLVTGEIEL
ncbi:XylR N-terminal domain-containing protein [Brevibacillus sp. NRS-1366]|uniref:XylR N-terminal domain-containing protein n=1 Tax=Brevibacillus sp. NRS-1366 TaxID=3233899 RepID=UPI003D233E29